MPVLKNVTLKPSVMKQKILTGNTFFPFFPPLDGRFQYFASIVQITLLSKLRKYNWTKLRGLNTMNFNLFNFPMHLDFCSLGDSLCFRCEGKDLNIIENPLVTVRNSFKSYKNLNGYIWSKVSVQCVWTKIQIGWF